MYVDMPIGDSAVTLVYSCTREYDPYEAWGQKFEDSGLVVDLHRVLYRGRSVALNEEWTELANQYILNLGE